jgi:hypothetical protein
MMWLPIAGQPAANRCDGALDGDCPRETRDDPMGWSHLPLDLAFDSTVRRCVPATHHVTRCLTHAWQRG